MTIGLHVGKIKHDMEVMGLHIVLDILEGNFVIFIFLKLRRKYTLWLRNLISGIHVTETAYLPYAFIKILKGLL